ncbi:hypothetical protein HP548_00610 [Paenibacillus taichungensis]|uniref:Uncharacterized protein n=1 Tax=Paenibacillus taichungensis TaxID=484184 RepID=A0ABX2MCQ7_9BACL|nr:hypothetical protein [Paenibacillus taichungensis]NUU52612.1 hypothetical protein [Paenibacillus taichungensis]
MATFDRDDEEQKEDFLEEIRMILAARGIEVDWKDIETDRKSNDAVVTLVFKNVVE